MECVSVGGAKRTHAEEAFLMFGALVLHVALTEIGGEEGVTMGAAGKRGCVNACHDSFCGMWVRQVRNLVHKSSALTVRAVFVLATMPSSTRVTPMTPMTGNWMIGLRAVRLWMMGLRTMRLRLVVLVARLPPVNIELVDHLAAATRGAHLIWR